MRMLAVIIGISQSEFKDVFFDMFSAGIRSRGFGRMSLSPNREEKSKTFHLSTHEFLIYVVD